MGWWQMRLAMSLTSSECRVAENIMTCTAMGFWSPVCHLATTLEDRFMAPSS